MTTQQQNINLAAFMQMIRVSEGTAGPDGYRTIVDSYADHPRKLIWINRINDYSSAAGAYQIIRKTWDGVRGKLGLSDFTPASQDAACVELIRQRGGLRMAMNGEYWIYFLRGNNEYCSGNNILYNRKRHRDEYPVYRRAANLRNERNYVCAP